MKTKKVSCNALVISNILMLVQTEILVFCPCMCAYRWKPSYNACNISNFHFEYIRIILKHLMHGNLKILSTIEYPLQWSSSSSFLPVQFCVSNKMDWQMLSNHLLDIFHHWTVWPVGSFCQKMPDNFWHPIAFPWLHYDVAIEGNSTGSLSILF